MYLLCFDDFVCLCLQACLGCCVVVALCWLLAICLLFGLFCVGLCIGSWIVGFACLDGLRLLLMVDILGIGFGSSVLWFVALVYC